MRPRLLDLFCGGGGAGEGYRRAGFDVFGVDIRPQPRYPFAFVQADALEHLALYGGAYDAVHASPPCQRYSKATRWRGDPASHPDLVAAVRAALRESGRPFVIESVPGAALQCPVVLCGSMFGLAVRRHRLFELSSVWALVPDCRHRPGDCSFDHGGKQTESAYREAMGCGWMTVHEARQAVPPAYTRYIGLQLRKVLDNISLDISGPGDESWLVSEDGRSAR